MYGMKKALVFVAVGVVASALYPQLAIETRKVIDKIKASVTTSEEE